MIRKIQGVSCKWNLKGESLNSDSEMNVTRAEAIASLQESRLGRLYACMRAGLGE